MKLDLFKQQWIEMVFDGKNKLYGAYELRKDSSKTSAIALIIGAIFFTFMIAAPHILGNLFNRFKNNETADVRKVNIQKLAPIEKPPEIIEKPKPPPPKEDQVKFVKPVVSKKEDVTEEPQKITPEVKKTGAETLKGDPEAPVTIIPPSDGDVVEADPNQLYNSAGIEVKPEFPGGPNGFIKFIQNNYQIPEEEGLKGKVYVQFVVEKDGSLTDIKLLRDIGYGTGAEAIRVLKKCPKWSPGIQNGKPVRCTYTQPISIQSPD